MKKRMTLLLCLLLVATALPATAEEPFVTYDLPSGATILSPSDIATSNTPNGLNAMYVLMKNASSQAEVTLFRMQNGRAMVSLSRMAIKEQQGVAFLQDLWSTSAIVPNEIDKEVAFVNSSPENAEITTAYGFQALSVNTQVIVGSSELMLLDTNCTVFYNGLELVEIWSVAPDVSTYLYDEKAAKELESDRADMQTLLNSLRFGAAEGGQA